MSAENPHAGQGAVLLDIGGEVGALVVSMPAAMVGDEIEIIAHAAPDHHDHGHGHGYGHGHGHHRPHVEVVDRPVSGGTLPSLVFPELHEGDYDLVDKGTDRVRLTVSIRGGEVTTAQWPH